MEVTNFNPRKGHLNKKPMGHERKNLVVLFRLSNPKDQPTFPNPEYNT